LPAHDSGEIHHDVKPSNILVSNQSENPIHAYLTDFAIGQIISDEIRSQLSVSGFSQAGQESASLSGTQLYMAPELFRGEAGVDSLGTNLRKESQRRTRPSRWTNQFHAV
jgi:serine/threonine protein kinase